MQGSRWWLVCYDIHDPERLRKAAKHLEGYGERMQWSVFRCWMTRLEMERLRWELTELLDPTDEVMLIPLCESCVAAIQGRPWPLKHQGERCFRLADPSRWS